MEEGRAAGNRKRNALVMEGKIRCGREKLPRVDKPATEIGLSNTKYRKKKEVLEFTAGQSDVTDTD